ncbi:MAG: NADPH-dependent FMN reductase [Opitutaceae bacterium]
MSDIVLISGSPSASSRTTAIVDYARRHFGARQIEAAVIHVREFPAEDLIHARYDSVVFDEAKALVANATGVVVGTPIYKAAYTGTVKTFLDILPQGALRGKIVLPIACGGSPAHLLAIDYALKPVLSTLGATDLLQGVYVVDDQARVSPEGELWVHPDLQTRFDDSLDQLATAVASRRSAMAAR